MRRRRSGDRGGANRWRTASSAGSRAARWRQKSCTRRRRWSHSATRTHRCPPTGAHPQVPTHRCPPTGAHPQVPTHRCPPTSCSCLGSTSRRCRTSATPTRTCSPSCSRPQRAWPKRRAGRRPLGMADGRQCRLARRPGGLPPALPPDGRAPDGAVRMSRTTPAYNRRAGSRTRPLLQLEVTGPGPG